MRDRTDDLKGCALIVGIRFAATLAILSVLATASHDAIAHVLLPLYRIVVDALALDLDVL